MRQIIAELGGEAVTTRDGTTIVHTEDVKTMLEEALKTEQAASDQYQKIMPMIKDHPVYAHMIYHILMDEMKAVVEVEALLNR